MSTPSFVRRYTRVFYRIKPDLSPISDAAVIACEAASSERRSALRLFQCKCAEGPRFERGGRHHCSRRRRHAHDSGFRQEIRPGVWTSTSRVSRKLIGVVNAALSSRDLPYVPEYCPNGFTEDRRKAFDLKNEYFYTHDARTSRIQRLFAKAEASLEGDLGVVRCGRGIDGADRRPCWRSTGPGGSTMSTCRSGSLT